MIVTNERADMAVVLPKTIVIAPSLNKRPISRSSLSFGGVNMISSDSDDAVLESSPRKRKRLTHLTPEERMLRRYGCFDIQLYSFISYFIIFMSPPNLYWLIYYLRIFTSEPLNCEQL